MCGPLNVSKGKMGIMRVAAQREDQDSRTYTNVEGTQKDTKSTAQRDHGGGPLVPSMRHRYFAFDLLI